MSDGTTTMRHDTEIRHWKRWHTSEDLWYVDCLTCAFRSAFVLSIAQAEALEAAHLQLSSDTSFPEPLSWNGSEGEDYLPRSPRRGIRYDDDRPLPVPPEIEPENPILQRLAMGRANIRSEKEQAEIAQALVQQLGLRMSSMPIRFLTNRNGEIQPYITASGAADICISTGASVTDVQMSVIDGCAVCRATVTTKDGRVGVGTGVVSLEGLKGEARANALMKSETKAIRRTTLRTCRPDAVWLLQEDDIDGIEGAKRIPPQVLDQPVEPPIEAPAIKSPKASSTSEQSVEGVITNTQVHGPTPGDPKSVEHYEITLTSPGDGFTPPEDYALLTTERAAYDVAATAEDQGVIFRAIWKLARRPNGKIGKLLVSLEPAK